MARFLGGYVTYYGPCISVYTGRDDTTYHAQSFEDVLPEHRERVAVLLAASENPFSDDAVDVELPGVGALYPGDYGPAVYFDGE